MTFRWIACVLSIAMWCAAPFCFAVERRPQELSKQIDQTLFGGDGERHREPADDATYLRRLSLDLLGRIPTVAEVRQFLDDRSDSKRQQAVQRMLDSGAYPRNMATFWRRGWVPQADTPEYAAVAEGFEQWLVKQLQQEVRYDDLVQAVITWDDDSSSPRGLDPRGFYHANDSRPANLAASATRAFLGINLDCAQCHDHPFARWSRQQFWQTAAFFVDSPHDADGAVKLPTIRIPETDVECQPRFLTAATKPTGAEYPDPGELRTQLADWMLAESENYLARNAVNRIWAHFFGHAIVEPIDDLSGTTAQQTERADLLDQLAQTFIDSGYDIDLLVQGIVLSDAYQVAAVPAGGHPGPARLAAGVSLGKVRGLTGEQLYDSLRTAAGLPAEATAVGSNRGSENRDAFVAKFYVERPHQAERSISQALAMMNGAFVNDLSSVEHNRLLASVASSPFLSAEEQIDTVFLAVLGRHATGDEMAAVNDRFKSHQGIGLEQNLGDLFWALVNGPEFNTNH
ncbi:DUF1549 domain-containing protein [Roseiconus nitratireducens]|uniref:DUF1549 domain-containing protein n=1 Tax=Roseiconus nitratireducens TaxID=2605748 RepID=A0A5M6D6B5_9BACT|nr:DUF1549 domain-containing protein [Roseiconus nitratireducens]KAA5542286.1 DUF1549 domain-containing protein [Roseiconus nitratireducens]